MKKIFFTYHEDVGFTTRDNIPLYVMMEGRSWGLTTLLITTVALWMVAFDRGETVPISFLEDIDVFQKWTTELIEYVIYSCVGACGVAVSVGTLHLNLRPPGKKWMRVQILVSSLCLFGVNLMSIHQTVWSMQRFIADDGTWKSKPAHGFLISCAVLCTLLADVLFVQYFGCCMCWGCCELPKLELPQSNPDLESDLLPEGTHPDDDDVVVEESQIEDVASDVAQTSQPKEPEIDASEIPPAVQKWEPEVREDQSTIYASSEASVEQASRRTAMSSGSSAPVVLNTWNTRRVLRNYEKSSHALREVSEHSVQSQHLPPSSDSVQSRNLSAESRAQVESVRERPRPEDLVWFVENIRTPRRWLENVVNAVKEEEGVFLYSVWVKASCLTTFCVVVYICIRTTHQIYRLCDTWSQGLGCLEYNKDVVRTFVQNLGCMSESWRNFLFNLMDYIDTVIPRLKYTVCIGYPIGCFFALHSVYSVMVQYKRLTMAMDHEVLMHERLVVPSQKSTIVKDLWPELEKLYPIGGAVYFLGILCSTAVLQLQVFGLLNSIVLAVLVNYEKYVDVMDFMGFYILIYLIIFAIDWLILHILPDRVLSTGLRIRRPRVFFVYMFVFSIVHLVLGFLYAIWRFFHLTLTTFLLLNRLDITISKEFKSLDSGHKAFMSLLVLTNIIQRDIFKKKKKRRFRKVRTAVKRVIRTLHGRSPSHRSS